MTKRPLLLIAIILVATLTAGVADAVSGYSVWVSSGPTFVSVPANSCVSASWGASTNLYTSIWNWSATINGFGSGRFFYATICNFNPPPFTQTSSELLIINAQTFAGGLSATGFKTIFVERRSF